MYNYRAQYLHDSMHLNQLISGNWASKPLAACKNFWTTVSLAVSDQAMTALPKQQVSSSWLQVCQEADYVV